MLESSLTFPAGFYVRIGNERSQAAEMTLQPGESEGGPDNRHPGSDQWLFVVSGRGVATVDGHTCRLRRGQLLLIERGQAHEIRCLGRSPLRTLNIYVPPAYDSSGNARPAP
jgi:mannose-6-phosphate isomerase-like protein (cupin superfamily)